MFWPQSIRLRKVCPMSPLRICLLSFSSLISQSSLSVLGALPLEGPSASSSLCLPGLFFPTCLRVAVCIMLPFPWGFFVYLCVPECTTFFQVLTEARRGHQTSQNWGSNSCELPCGGSELNSGSLKEQPMLFTTQAFLQLSLIFPESLSKLSLLSQYVSLFPSPAFLLNALLLCGTQYILYIGPSVPFLSHQNAHSANDLFVLFRYVAILFLKPSRWHAVDLN